MWNGFQQCLKNVTATSATTVLVTTAGNATFTMTKSSADSAVTNENTTTTCKSLTLRQVLNDHSALPSYPIFQIQTTALHILNYLVI